MSGLAYPPGERDTGVVTNQSYLGFAPRRKHGKQSFQYGARNGKRQVCQTAITHLSSRLNDSCRPARISMTTRTIKGSGRPGAGNPVVRHRSSAGRLVSGARRCRLREGARPG